MKRTSPLFLIVCLVLVSPHRLPAPIQEIPESSPPSSIRQNTATGLDSAIAFVDINKIFKAYNKTKDAEAKINETKSQARKGYDDRANAYKKAIDEINGLNKQLASGTLSPDAKSRMQLERDDKIANTKQIEKDITEFRITWEKQLQDQAFRVREGVVSEIRAKIELLDNHGSNLIFDGSGNSLNGVPILVLSPSSADMSTNVTTALNGGATSSFVPAQSLRVGLVDMNHIFREYNKAKDAESKLNAMQAATKKEIDAQARVYGRALTAKDPKAKDLGREAKTFRQKRENEIQEQALRMRIEIMVEVMKAVGAGFPSADDAIVFDSSGKSLNGIEVLIYERGMPDLSSEIISALNQQRNPSHLSDKLMSAKTCRFAIIDMNRAFKANPETKKGETAINDAIYQVKKEYDHRAGAYKKALDEISSSNKQLESTELTSNIRSRLTQERDRKIVAVKKMENDITDFRQSRERQLQEQALKLREPIVEALKKTTSDLAKKRNFNMVFDSSGSTLEHPPVVMGANDIFDPSGNTLNNGVPVVIAAREVPDLTDEVIAKVQTHQ